MWLVLCDDDDQSAQWAAAGLELRGLTPVKVVTAGALGGGKDWLHRVSNKRKLARVTLPDGSRLDSDDISGVLNQLTWVWCPKISFAAPSDRDYAVQEFNALIVSWLASLPPPVINRATSRGLAGPWHHESTWRLLAGKAGLRTVPFRMPGPPLDVAPTPAEASHWAIVFGDAVYGADLDPALTSACGRLVELAGADMLGIEFGVGRTGEWTFRAATSKPDLRLGGDPLLDAIAATMRNQR